MIDAWQITSNPNLKRIGKTIQVRQSVPSTNWVLSKMVESEQRAQEGSISEGSVLLAEEQTSGRGQGDRVWVSPRGKGLWFSVFLKPDMASSQIYLITFLGAVAVAEAVKREFDLNAMIKWPNDVHVKGRKFCGILTQSSLQGNRVDSAILGIGINLNQTAKEMNQSYGPIASSLRMILHYQIEAQKIFKILLEELDRLYDLLKTGQGELIVQKWKENATFLEQKVTMILGDLVYKGIAKNIDDRGGLILLLNDGTEKTFYSGDLCL